MNPVVGLLIVYIFCSVSVSVADETVRVGEEIQVNTYTTANQGAPEIAVDSQGNFIVVWESQPDQDGDFWGIFGQRIGADGTPLDAEFQINTYTTEFQTRPFVATDGPGNFIVVWQSFGQDGAGDYGVFGQRFDSSGNALGEEFQVNTYTTNYQGHPAVAADDAGNFLVVWESTTQDLSLGGIYGQLYDSSGNAVGGEFQVNTTTAGDQNDPRAFAREGGFGVVWESDLSDGSDEGVVMQFLDSNAALVGGETQVNTHTFGNQEDPAVVVSPDGTFAIVWESESQDGDSEGVFGQVFDSFGAPVGGELQLNTYTTSRQDDPSVALDGTGGFIAAWGSAGQVDGSNDFDIYGQRFDATGTLVGGEFQINQQASYSQDLASVAGGVDSRFMVVWHSSGGLDGSGFGVFGQRLATVLFADGFESGDTSAWSVTTP